MDSSYVCAGCETIGSILEKFLNGPLFDDHFTPDQVGNFFQDSCNKFLHSFGQNFRGKKRLERYVKRESETFQFCRDTGCFDGARFIVDSGGFQASVGLLDKRDTDILMDLYYNYLVDYPDTYDRAFLLDIPPGPGCTIFNNFNEVYDLNEFTYLKARDLPQAVKEKMVYIHHFRTPKLWDIYTKLMDDHDLFNEFNFHATGGVVANMKSDVSIPCIIYILPMIPLLNRAKKYGRKHLDFHILGGASFRDILFYEFFKLHVKHVHDIDLEITFDSSGVFKGLMVGRHVYIMDGDIVRKTDIRTPNLNKKWKGEMTVMESFRNAISEMSNRYGFKQIGLEEIYEESTGTFPYDVRTYTVLYVLYFFAKVQDAAKRRATEIYPLFNDNREEFNLQAELITRDINQGKITRKQRSKTNSLSRSLDMLTSLDEDHCKYIVSTYLGKDEFVELMPDRILTV